MKIYSIKETKKVLSEEIIKILEESLRRYTEFNFDYYDTETNAFYFNPKPTMPNKALLTLESIKKDKVELGQKITKLMNEFKAKYNCQAEIDYRSFGQDFTGKTVKEYLIDIVI